MVVTLAGDCRRDFIGSAACAYRLSAFASRNQPKTLRGNAIESAAARRVCAPSEDGASAAVAVSVVKARAASGMRRNDMVTSEKTLGRGEPAPLTTEVGAWEFRLRSGPLGVRPRPGCVAGRMSLQCKALDGMCPAAAALPTEDANGLQQSSA